MMEAIRGLPAGGLDQRNQAGPLYFRGRPGRGHPGQGWTIDPEDCYITLDFSESDDTVPGGLNMSRATVMAAGITGVLNNLDPTLPQNGGAFSRIRIVMREGSVVGPAAHPTCASMATTTVADRVINVVQSCFAQIGREIGMAEGSLGMPASSAVISGVGPAAQGGPLYQSTDHRRHGRSGH